MSQCPPVSVRGVWVCSCISAGSHVSCQLAVNEKTMDWCLQGSVKNSAAEELFTYQVSRLEMHVLLQNCFCCSGQHIPPLLLPGCVPFVSGSSHKSLWIIWFLWKCRKWSKAEKLVNNYIKTIRRIESEIFSKRNSERTCQQKMICLRTFHP